MQRADPAASPAASPAAETRQRQPATEPAAMPMAAPVAETVVAVPGPEGTAQRELVQSIAHSPRMAAQRQQWRGTFGGTAQLEARPSPPPNRSGLPDGLKAGIESLSGMAMDHVQVHRNSSKPAQLNALAYAQGSDIHLAPGQEQHLPHEAWHVVQQAQGRVRPTVQLMQGVQLNVDPGLEAEADAMGRRAAGLHFGAGDLVPEPVGRAATSAAGSSTGDIAGAVAPVQRYAQIDHPVAGRLLVSESKNFFKPVDARRELWARLIEIGIAASTMQLNDKAILNVESAESRELFGSTYHRVKVVERTGPSMHRARGEDSKRTAVQPMKHGAEGPFELVESWLRNRPANATGQKVMVDMQGDFQNPYPNQSYPFGALSAIKIQVSLELARHMETLPPTALFPRDELIAFLLDWKERIAVVNSETAHGFHFLCTECGGFSKMVMGGRDAGQSEAIVGDRMMMNDLDGLPGPWRNHYAAVIMTDGGDRVTIESAASMDDWWFGMYGALDASQTFIVKTLMTKLHLGAARGEGDAGTLEKYVQARLDGSPLATTIAASLDPQELANVERLLTEAGVVVATRTADVDLATLIGNLPAYRLLVEEMPPGNYENKSRAKAFLARGSRFIELAKLEKLPQKRIQLVSFAKSSLSKAHDAVIDERLDRDRAKRWSQSAW